MSATDELRRLLDERGIEWKGFEGDQLGFVKAETAWGEVDGLGNYNYWVAEYFDGTTLLNIGNPTPEQAVEATLGRGTCRMTRVEDEKRILHGWMECSECGPVYPPAAERIQDAVKFCPFCGRKVVDA